MPGLTRAVPVTLFQVGPPVLLSFSVSLAPCHPSLSNPCHPLFLTMSVSPSVCHPVLVTLCLSYSCHYDLPATCHPGLPQSAVTLSGLRSPCHPLSATLFMSPSIDVTLFLSFYHPVFLTLSLTPSGLSVTLSLSSFTVYRSCSPCHPT